jgi:malonyl-CoA/methylmalonyl-CoA synthetase
VTGNAASFNAPSARHLPPGVHPRAIDLLADDTLVGRWLRQWTERPSSRQLHTADGGWISSDELESRTERAARRFCAAGLVPGGRLLLSARTSAELIIAYVAALRVGLIVVPVNPDYTSVEIGRIVRSARPDAAVVDADQTAAWIRDASPTPIRITGVDLDELPGPSDEEQIDLAHSGDAALLLYTSGTTGSPKGALLTHANLLSSATAVGLAWRWEPDDALLLALPLFHLHGLGVGVNGSLCAGASIMLRPRFDPADIAEHAGRGASMFFGVPAMYQRLASAGLCPALRPLRLLVSGSAPLSAALANEVAAGAGQMPLERYGMTETVMITSNPYEGERRPGTVGFPLPGVDVRIGSNSEVQVTGPNVTSGYDNSLDATAEAFTDDGWFRTGDLGEIDADGYLRLVGRGKDLIITGGLNVHPREVEEALATHPCVREVAVIGRASDRWGEQVTAVVVAMAPVDAAELKAHAAHHLAPYKVPKEVEFVAELPRNALGKVLRGEI